jgi:two-component system, LytTR family, sensor kinase
MALAGIYLLTKFSTLFKGSISNEWLRKNVIVWLVIFFLSGALSPISGNFFYVLAKYGYKGVIIIQLVATTANTLLVYNAVLLLSHWRWFKRQSFIKQQLIITFLLVLMTVVVNAGLTWLMYKTETQYVKYSIASSIFFATIAGLIYSSLRYLGLESKRKFDEKELEVSRLRELKTKAELDALHSKINPHFLYNALNSIADLSITDGKKARKMTIALGDLFRYSINHSNHNYSSVKDEVEMAEVYLQIEKIRFEDQLTYSIKADAGFNHYLLPRFILQPIVENAVKHGLKATGKMTEIQIEVAGLNEGLLLTVADNGPLFPDELSPGYGVKSIFDKLDLLFPNQYEVRFTNEPRKHVTVHIQKLMKDEPVV